jgi:hypothetical protein
MAEEFRAFRFKRHIRHIEKARKQLEAAGMSPRRVPLRVLAPLLEGGSLEDDEDLSERWAALLANAAGDKHNVPPSFPKVLSELEPVEAVIMDDLYQLTMRLAPEFRRRQHGLNGLDTARLLGLSEDEYHYHAGNLVRLGLAESPPEPSSPILVLADFGRAFIRACWPPDRPDPEVVFKDAAELFSLSRENKARRARATPTASGDD